MSKSPGHLKWPDHQVKELHSDQRVRVEVDGELIADSRNVVRVDEDKHPVRYYFPRADVRMELLERSTTTTECPFKGTATYFHLKRGERKLDDAVWSYETPYDEHLGLSGRLAFYDERYPTIRVQVIG